MSRKLLHIGTLKYFTVTRKSEWPKIFCRSVTAPPLRMKAEAKL